VRGGSWQEVVIWALGGGRRRLDELKEKRERMKGNREVGARKEEQRADV